MSDRFSVLIFFYAQSIPAIAHYILYNCLLFHSIGIYLYTGNIVPVSSQASFHLLFRPRAGLLSAILQPLNDDIIRCNQNKMAHGNTILLQLSDNLIIILPFG